MSKWPWKDGSGPKWHAPRALRMQLKRRASACRGGDYNEVPQPQATQKKSRPSPSNFVTPFACKLLSEQVFGFRKANIVECRVFASHFPSDEVQNEAEVTPDLIILLRAQVRCSCCAPERGRTKIR